MNRKYKKHHGRFDEASFLVKTETEARDYLTHCPLVKDLYVEPDKALVELTPRAASRFNAGGLWCECDNVVTLANGIKLLTLEVRRA